MRREPLKRSRRGEYLYLFFVCIMMTICGCSHDQSKATLAEANALFSQGNYQASLEKYGQIEKNPETRDRVLFEMGIIHAYPKNDHKDYQKALECFQRVINEYPVSGYRQNSEMMIFNITNVAVKDQTIAAQQAQIETLRRELQGREKEIGELQTKIRALEQKVFANAIRNGSVEKILIEKKARRLTLISRGEVLKSYRIALGGNPVGPKEREGDNKTPEGTYFIDARNKDSYYYRSLRISYPNERDRKRARKQGVSPGGNIMIHGIKKGFSWVGGAHTDVDWTQGCIAVTDEEIEEIARLAPNGTMVEIKP
jgi:L,D-peptidoglycan transpeptidase YkuD (ErfK/YbiS/YcfS/YnhG family)